MWVDMIVMETDITVLYYCASGCDVVGVCLFVILFIDSDVCVCVFTHLNTDGDDKAVVIL